MDALLIARFVQAAAAVVLAGTLLLRLFALGTAARGVLRWNWLAWGSWGALALAGSVVLVLTTASMTDQSFLATVQGNTVGFVLEGTYFGKIWLWRAGLLGGVFIVGLVIKVIRRYFRRRVPVVLDAANGLLAAAVLANLVWAGHAQMSAQKAWLLPADVLHVLAAGAWPGGLVPLVVLLVRARRDPDLVPSTATVARRFSVSSVVAVGVLGFSGVVNGVGVMGSLGALWPAELWTHVYGRLLLCKVTLFVVMVGLGALNRRLVKLGSSGHATGSLGRLSRNVAWECVLAVGVVLATEALSMSAPPGG